MRIVEKLRDRDNTEDEYEMACEAADEIERLTALLEEAEAALEEAADQLDACGDMLEGRHVEPLATRRVARSARALLAKLREGGE